MRVGVVVLEPGADDVYPPPAAIAWQSEIFGRSVCSHRNRIGPIVLILNKPLCTAKRIKNHESITSTASPTHPLPSSPCGRSSFIDFVRLAGIDWVFLEVGNFAPKTRDRAKIVPLRQISFAVSMRMCRGTISSQRLVQRQPNSSVYNFTNQRLPCLSASLSLDAAISHSFMDKQKLKRKKNKRTEINGHRSEHSVCVPHG